MREAVNHTDAHAVKTTGNLVRGRIEFSAGVQDGKHDLSCGELFSVIFHVIHGDAASVVHDGNGVIDVNRDVDAIAVASQSLVNRVVDDFVHDMLKSHLSRT